MKTLVRTLKIAGIALAVLVVAVVGLFAVTFMGRKKIADGLEINGIRIVRDSIVTICVIPIGPGQVALIDAGNDKSGKAIMAELKRRDLGPEAVRAILLTHGHGDHIGAVPLFRKAEVMILTADIELAEGRAGSRGPMQQFFPPRLTGVRVNRPLRDGDILKLGRFTVQVYSIPGHTEGSAAFLVNGVLVMGDSADASSKGRLNGAPWLFSDDQSRNRESLVRLGQTLVREKAQVKALVFSHSGALVSGLGPLTAFTGK
jgi:glyoxylase-like metal-dependent hydrolase (beta-lactamase superfamily II)